MSHVPVIIGAGLAGLTVALSLAPLPVVVIGRKPSDDLTSSKKAQGGIAAAVAHDDDPNYQIKDTLGAGAGCCDEAVVRHVVSAAPDAVKQLQAWGVEFDRNDAGELDLGLEAAHSHRRIVHAGGDSTGAVIMEAMIKRVKATPSITLIDGEAQHIEQSHDDNISGLTYYDVAAGASRTIRTNNIILATGSAAALWEKATVPKASWGSGLLLAAQVGARLKDLEFVQFHPTALDAGQDPMALISEAVRGDGAVLVNDKGESFVNSLAARDVVARSVWRQIEIGNQVFVDARKIENFSQHFPTVNAACQQAGIDPQYALIPVTTTAHYHMGGVETDKDGRTNVEGLWACGECACTGLHGANRLASNSLLEAVVMGQKVAGALRPTLAANAEIESEGCWTFFPRYDQAEAKVRQIMALHVGVCRTQHGLEQAVDALSALALSSAPARLALLITKAAMARPYSCGAHERIDTLDFSRRLAS